MNSIIQTQRVREAVTKTARLLARDSVEVRQAGGTPHVAYDKSGKVLYVNLPIIPDNASKEFLDSVQGFLDHEVAHVLFTDNNKLNAHLDRAEKDGMDKKAVRSLANAFEDVRINKAMCDKFKGSAHNITNAYDFVIQKMLEPQIKLAQKMPASEKRDAAIQASAFVIWLRAKSGNADCQKYLDDHDLGKYFEKMERDFPDFADRLNRMETSEDASRLAYDFSRTVVMPPMADTGDGTGDGKGTGKPKKAKPHGEPKKVKSKAEKSEDKEKAEGKSKDKPEDKGAGKDEGDEADGEGDGAGEGDEGDDEGEGFGDGGDGDEGEEGTEPSGTSNPEGTSTALGEALGRMKDMDEMMGSIISERVADEYRGVSYVEYTRDYDQIEKVKADPTQPVDKMEERVAKVSGVMQKDLQRLIVARKQSVMVPGFRRGKINPAALHRVEAGDDRVFRRKHVNPTNHVAVQLVVDCSGSMGGNKIALALESAWAFSSVLDRLNIANEVIGFTTTGLPRGDDSTKYWDAHREFARQIGRPASEVRSEPLLLPVFKDFSERFTIDVKRRMAQNHPEFSKGRSGDGRIGLSQNIDGACLLESVRRLLPRGETRKLMIVFSDGEPAAGMPMHILRPHLKEAVKLIERNGVEVIGVGIQHEGVKAYYRKHFIVHSLGELPGKVIRELRDFLMKA